MRRLFTVDEADQRGISRAALRWGVRTGRWSQVDRGVFVVGTDAPSPLERAVGAVVATGGVASGALAGVLLELDGIVLRRPVVTVPPGSSNHRRGVRRHSLAPERVVLVQGICCTDGLQTLLDLAAVLGDLEWEQALESALRKKLTTIDELADSLAGVRGAARIRRVLAMRPEDLSKAVERVGGRQFRIKVIAGEVKQAPAASLPSEPKQDDVSRRALDNADVQRFREVFGGEVRAVRDLKGVE
jgi:hypothetical protein